MDAQTIFFFNQTIQETITTGKLIG